MENPKEGLDDKFKEISHSNEQTEIENRRVNILGFGLRSGFQDVTPKAETEGIIQSFILFASKDTIKKMKK